MREIKFRAWDNELKYMVTSEASIGNILKKTIEGGYNQLQNGNLSGEDMKKFNRYNLIQYTGLKDKNGVEIYEGDILEVNDDYDTYGFMAGEKREVYYKDGCFRFKPLEKHKNQRGHILEDNNEFKIIGNIYEKPKIGNLEK